MRAVRQHIALFYIALMLLFKVAGLHAIAHHTDDVDTNHCEVCEISTVVNFTPLVGAEIADISENPAFFVEEKLNNSISSVVLDKRFVASNLHTRPPPALS